MSSPTTTTATSNGNNVVGQTTYWCHECDMSFSLVITTTQSHPELTCPHCHGDFLEEMDSPHFQSQNPSPNFSSLPPPLHNHHPHPHPHPILSQTITPTTDDDIPIRLSNAYLLDRLIQHLTDPDDDNNDNDDINIMPGGANTSSPASKASIESMPTIKITSSFLGRDSVLCAVCKDEFFIDVEAKQLPCNHIYHCECILPWLSQHNSCPVCRFLLPTDENESRRRSTGTGRVPVRFGNLMDDDDEEEEDEFGVGTTLRHIVRRHRFVFTPRPAGNFGSSSSPTQIAQAETSSAGPANSGETVSSRPVGSRFGWRCWWKWEVG
ncbi:hypothetical protein IFM89_016390 [Coptis chinensis]|uniref:RING-type E3 ubiquitin transferase n=1 Tax=Coptis chinensis TaxID=261450 RepID=A0A835LMV2_9MAGN|nr:hypothetical protein IFM89_016390 [Coptis chinensis]